MALLKKLLDMSGRRVLLTGATGKLGTMISECMAELGAELILVDLKNSNFSNVLKKIKKIKKVKVEIIKCDLINDKERGYLIGQILKDKKSLNCLINCAAFIGSSKIEGWSTAFENQSLESWKKAIDLNLTAAFHISQGLYPKLKKSKGANIINISSIYGELGPDWSLYRNTNMANPAGYSVSKGGLNQLTRWLATTISPEVRVNAISPGGIFRNQNKQFINRYIKKTPLRRMAAENDIKGAIAYLASDLSRYVTGQIINVDGGWSAW